MPTKLDAYRDFASRCRREREQRIDALWERYLSLVNDAERSRVARFVSTDSRITALHAALRSKRTRPESWEFASLIEAADVGLEKLWHGGRSPKPCECRCGTRAKIAVLAERLARGEELHAADDE